MPDQNGNALPGEPNYSPGNQSGSLINANPAQTPAQAPAIADTDTTKPVTQPKVATAAPTDFVADPNNSVASNVEKIITKGSPLLEQAETRAKQKMAQRGLLNSTQVISAGQSAVYDAALPIATTDAQIQAAADTNTAQARNTAALANAQMVNAASTVDKQLSSQERMQQFQLLADKEKINLDGGIKQSLAATEASYKVLMQTSAGAQEVYKQALANMSAIITNPNVPDKTAALNLQMSLLNDALGQIGAIGNMDLGAYLNFSDGSGAAAAPAPAAPSGGLINTVAAAPAPAALSGGLINTVAVPAGASVPYAPTPSNPPPTDDPGWVWSDQWGWVNMNSNNDE